MSIRGFLNQASLAKKKRCRTTVRAPFSLKTKLEALSLGGLFDLRGGLGGLFHLGLAAAHRARGAVALGELVHATGGIDEALLAREERVARGADADADVFHRGARVIDGAAGAGNGGIALQRQMLWIVLR